jgi:tetratricopeptide (TPR) repeat protein
MGWGFANRSTGELDEAVSNLFAGTELIDSNGEYKEFLVYCFQQLGEIHTAIHEYEIAILYFKNAFSASSSKTSASHFRFHLGLGGCYLQMKDYEKSKFHLTKALEVEDLPAPIMSRIENDLGTLYLEMKEYELAETWLTRSLTIRESNGLEDAACTSMTALAEVYLNQNKIIESLQLLDRCLLLVEKFQAKWKKIKVLSLRARAHSQIKNHELAVGYYDQYKTLYDELKGEQERNIFKFKNAQIEKQKK